jgi:predicted amidohydrolase YtcJ
MKNRSSFIHIHGGLVWQWDASPDGQPTLYSATGRPMVHKDGHAAAGKSVLISRSSGRVVDVVDTARIGDILQQCGVDAADVETMDASGQLLIPGLHDAHIHVANTGECMYHLDLSGCKSIGAMVEAIRGHGARHPQLPWIIGISWDQTDLGR